MLTVTLSQLRTQTRQRADMENTQFVSDSELNDYLNASAAELNDLLIGTYEDYRLSTYSISVVAGTASYNLPSDFYKLRGVDLVLDNVGNAVTLKPFNFGERNAYMFTPTWNVVGLAYLRYHIKDDQIMFVPVPNNASTVKLWYIPCITRMSSDSDTLDGVNGYEEYVIIDAAIKMKIKEESDISELLAQKQAMKMRIEAMAAGRDAGMPEKVSDVTKQASLEFWTFSGGQP